MTLGERVLILRRRLKLSQGRLGKASGIDPNTIARLERGEVNDLAGARIITLARALGVSTDVLLGEKPLDDTGDMEPTELATAGREA
jgi:transcriptional regulator with XRE-family HTH domain